MKLRNKKTGEIIILIDHIFDNYKNLAELNEEWEDYEEPKKYWFIDAYGNIVQNEITKHYGDEYTDMTNEYENQKQIGNHFETEAEAKKAVEFLKALKKLKDNGIRFELNIKDYDLKIRHKRVLDDIEAKETYEALKQVAGVND